MRNPQRGSGQFPGQFGERDKRKANSKVAEDSKSRESFKTLVIAPCAPRIKGSAAHQQQQRGKKKREKSQ